MKSFCICASILMTKSSNFFFTSQKKKIWMHNERGMGEGRSVWMERMKGMTHPNTISSSIKMSMTDWPTFHLHQIFRIFFSINQSIHDILILYIWGTEQCLPFNKLRILNSFGQYPFNVTKNHLFMNPSSLLFWEIEIIFFTKNSSES